jgi:hypothetical protein
MDRDELVTALRAAADEVEGGKKPESIFKGDVDWREAITGVKRQRAQGEQVGALLDQAYEADTARQAEANKAFEAQRDRRQRAARGEQ